ncbi:MAG: DUF4276 family protein [Firmicutes bacterium]|nr:DUF4276 family protein [Bacillota bacterium]
MVTVDILVEGWLDEMVARKAISFAGHQPGTVFGKHGLGYLKNKLSGFNELAAHSNPILALVDFMDTGLECPPQLVESWLPQCSPRFLLRVVVREIESWLLADREGISGFLKIPLRLVPEQPEKLPDPKQTLLQLARRSPSRRLREAMLPGEGFSSSVGPGYTDVMNEFVFTRWNIDEARQCSPSLARCLRRLMELAVL